MMNEKKSILEVNNKNASKSKVLENGPLESVFPGSTSKILDFLATFKDWDYSISDISRNSGLSFKTALGEVKNLESQDVIFKTRNVGKANMYKLNLDSNQGHYIDKLIFEIAKKRATEQANQPVSIPVKSESEQARYSLKNKMEELKG